MYWVGIGAYIYTVADLSIEDFTAAAGTIAAAAGSGANATSSVTVKAMSSSKLVNLMSAYHLFGLLWTNNLIQAISMCTIAGVCTEYYW